ncbi:lipopolysaccharide biosynthesis protein [Sphingomonas gellani]|nr:lipopolysaccharide biosynthesis protein [Sphingomonas gellani]
MARNATRGAATTAVAQAFKVVTTMLTTVIVARLLSPDDYGVTAMVAPVAGFILIFQNLGLNSAVIQAKTLDPEHSNALFWVNMAASAAIAVVMVAIAPLVGLFYHDTRAALVTAATAATVLVSGAKLQHQALLNREMRFSVLSLNDVVSAAATLFGTVIAAYFLRNYWAIWIGAFVGAMSSTLMMWANSGWRPRLGANFAGTRKLIAFGASITGFNLVNFLARNADNVIIAKAQGSAQLGLYDRSYKLMLFPLQNINQPLSRVMTPALSRMQDEPARYRRAYLLALRGLAIVSLPGVITAAICSGRVVEILLGPKWMGAAPIFFWLSLTALAQIVANTTGWLYVSTGQGRRQFVWGVTSSLISLASFAIGIPFGAVGVARAYFFGQLLGLPFLYWSATRNNPVSYGSLITVQLPSLIAGVITFVISRTFPASLPSVYFVGLTAVIAYSLALALQAVSKSGREALLEMFGMVRRA